MKSKGFCNNYSFLQKKIKKLFEKQEKGFEEITETYNSSPSPWLPNMFFHDH